ncbi:hypothetical protein H0H81_001989 [Sphagnurus paluster]|uniref:Zn(2)-C6 fungal-type domain-containing protein n=1 Tax=Sphagnurus paluster TaxID=117069 RepID=A0A9P7GW51_9AGAR|nr:hypothetical protein H0H81_001989 [Sphagnurus paluster]
MSSVASSSVGNMPPRHGKKLAEVMDEAFKSNGMDADEGETEKPKSDARSTEAPAVSPAPPADSPVSGSAKVPVARKIEGYTFQINTVYPPQPCERCIRSKKTCRGIEGARCEHCKSLHQKCSNSTGPPRGRHAGKCSSPLAHHIIELKSLLAMTALRQTAATMGADHGAEGSVEPARVKRKPNPTKKVAESEFDEDDDGSEEKLGGPPRKKRRVPGDHQTNAAKDVADLEAAIKKMQATTAKDLAKLAQLAASLSAQLAASLSAQLRAMDN